jgi:hypothetical protein
MEPWPRWPKTLQSKLKERANYDTEIKGDPIKMLQAIQENTMSYQENWYDAKIATNAIRNIMYTKQRDDEDLVDYTSRFKTAKDFLEAQLGGKLKIDKMAKEDEEWDETNALPAAPLALRPEPFRPSSTLL